MVFLKMMLPENFYLYFVSFIVNIHSFSSGSAYSWTSPVLPILTSNSEWNPLPKPTTLTEVSIITSIINLGAAAGALFSGYLAQKIGRKNTLLLSAIPMIIAHLMSAFAGSVWEFYISRVLFGLGMGTCYTVVPMYMGEIATDSNRGSLGCAMTLLETFGMLYGFVIGPFVSVRTLGFLYLIPSVLFFVLSAAFAPESPYYLLTKHDVAGARHALITLRGCSSVEKELAHMQTTIASEERTVSFSRTVLTIRSVRRALLVTLGLYFLQQFTGIIAILNYMQTIFEAAGTQIAPEVASIVVASVQCLTVLLSALIVDKLGRKILLFISTTGCSVSLFALGTYFYLKVNDFDVTAIWWLPLTSLTSFITVQMIGLGPLAPCIAGEIFPSNVKDAASAGCTSFCLLVTFLITMAFPYLSDVLGMAASICVFAVISFLGIIFIKVVVPETKGKSFMEIQKELGGVVTRES